MIKANKTREHTQLLHPQSCHVTVYAWIKQVLTGALPSVKSEPFSTVPSMSGDASLPLSDGSSSVAVAMGGGSVAMGGGSSISMLVSFMVCETSLGEPPALGVDCTDSGDTYVHNKHSQIPVSQVLTIPSPPQS